MLTGEKPIAFLFDSGASVNLPSVGYLNKMLNRHKRSTASGGSICILSGKISEVMIPIRNLTKRDVPWT